MKYLERFTINHPFPQLPPKNKKKNPNWGDLIERAIPD